MVNTRVPGIRNAAIAIGLATLVVSSPAWAQGASSVRVRGAIERLDGDTLHVRTRGGSEATLHLAADVRVTGLTKASWADIKPGSYIGTAAIEQTAGSAKSLEVQVFPESMRGVGEGSRAYDLGPKSSMTNGTIGQVVDTGNGRQVTIKYQGAEKTVVVPPDAPIVTYVPAARNDLAPGAKVIVTASKQPDGTLQADRILVGKDGLEPPM